MLKAIEARGVNDLAKHALQTSGQVFRYAIAHGLAKRNPATDIKPSDVLASRQKQNLARIDGKELPELLRHIEAYQGAAITRLAMKLMAMTFVRTTELIGAQWAEFDLDAARHTGGTYEDENPAHRAFICAGGEPAQDAATDHGPRRYAVPR